MSRSRRVLILALGALLAGAAVRGLLAVVEAALEGRVRARIVSEAAERGFRADVDAVRVRLPFRASLSGVSIAGHGLDARVDRIDVRAGFTGRGLAGRLRRLEIGRLSAELPQGLSILAEPAAWDVSSRDGLLWLSGRSGEGAFALEKEGGRRLRVRADRLDLTRLVRVRRDGASLGDLGVATGTLGLAPAVGGGFAVDANVVLRRVRLALPPEEDAPAEDSLGDPFDAEGSLSATIHPEARYVEVACASGDAAGVLGSARGIAAFAPRDAWLDVELAVPRLELGPLLAASGLELPAGDGDLGSAELAARIRGRMLDPKSWVVEENLDFRPPARALPEVERLRGPFRRVMTGRDGRRTPVAVDPASPDFVPLDDVPAHFVRGLLTSEDADFWGHPGLDLGEIPVAASMNWVRGRRARGASTITQQLAKNLFLTRERSYRRKLQEAALALHLESTLGKRRILEIYLNVIEWGPGLHGLGPAARHYFGKNPQDLTPREGAFLVALIPGPVKYQPSFASGVLSRGFTRLVNGVLRRLASVGMLAPEELKAELETPLRLRWTPAEVPGEEPLPGEAESDALEPDEEVLDATDAARSAAVDLPVATDEPSAPELPTPPSPAAPATNPVPAAVSGPGAATPTPPTTSPAKESPVSAPPSLAPAPRPTPRGTAPPG
ncbi:MAG: transglycosylase domain-containing protein [Thermoanaerobaculia bacterium]|nr:transglycosylase domain-containing protein [Thermoanaerobaculia bacterium]